MFAMVFTTITTIWRPGFNSDLKYNLKPGLHIVVIVASTVTNMFVTLDAHENFDYNITSLTGIVINCSISSSCNDQSNH